MVDPVSEHGEAEDVPDCTRCGVAVDGDDRRVITSVDGERVVKHHFCGSDCAEAWLRRAE